MKKTLTAALFAMSTSSALAQTPPPCESAPYRAFDFWLGHWEVFTPDGQKAGENRISAQENNCLVLEEWTSQTGNTGQSYNFYNPAKDEWRQVWVSGGAVIDYTGGLNEDGAMVLVGEIDYRNGTSFPFRGVWTPQDDGTVKQHFKQFDPDADEWKDWFIGIYKKKSD